VYGCEIKSLITRKRKKTWTEVMQNKVPRRVFELKESGK
jgi:hypothetical protein